MSRLVLPAAVIAFLLVAPPAAFAAEPDDSWPSFRGGDRTAVSQETGLLQQWPEGGPPLVWKATGAGRGYASLAISGGRVFTLGDAPSTAPDEDEYLVCFSQETGKPIWRTQTGAPWTSGRPDWQSSRSTPTVDGDRVYALTPAGVLFCCKTDDGAVIWKKDLKADFGGRKADSWGYSESVLIDGDRVICTPGGATTTIAALNKMTGEPVWRTSRPGDRGAGHASPVISVVGDTKVYVQSTGSGPLGVRASDGELLWDYDIDRTTAVIPTPIIRDDLVFFVAGYGRGGALLKQVPRNGGVAIEEIYSLKPALANKHGGVVLIGDYLYGDSEDRGTPYCAELMTGEIKWKSRGSGKRSACVAAADGKLYVRYQDGVLALVPASPEGYMETSTMKIPGSGDRPDWSHPVILGGKLYLREQDSILCYDISAEN